MDGLAGQYAHLSSYNYADNNPINDFDIDGNQNNNSGNSEGSGTNSTNNSGQGGGAAKNNTPPNIAPQIQPLSTNNATRPGVMQDIQNQTKKFEGIKIGGNGPYINKNIPLPNNQKETSLRTPNPSGFNKDFVKDTEQRAQAMAKLDEFKKTFQEVHPASPATNPAVQAAAVYLLTRNVGLTRASLGSQFLVRSSMDALQQGLVKGDFRKVDFFDAGITGIALKRPVTDLAKSFISYDINKGLTLNTDATDLGAELFARTLSNNKYVNISTNPYEQLGIDLSKKFFISKSMGLYKEINE